MQERWRLSKYKVKKILRFFCLDISASKTALLLGYNRKTIDRYFNIFREHILKYQSQIQGPLSDEALPQSWLKPELESGKPRLGLLKRDGQIFLTLLSSDANGQLRSLPAADSISSGGGWPELLFQDPEAASDGARARGRANELKAFWSFAKRRLAQFNGIAPNKLMLHLKECEFRFNNAKSDLFELMSKDVLKF